MLSKAELERYSRNILYFGKQKQIKLKSSKVGVIGAGGIGSALLTYLASSGIGEIIIFDDDIIERSNLARQNIFRESDIGLSKSISAKKFLTELNPHINVIGLNKKFTLKKDLPKVDLLLEGSDSIATKFDVNDYGIKNQIPFIIAAIGTEQGHILSNLNTNQACYRCLFEEKPKKETSLPSCSRDGVLAPVPGVIGNMMALLALKVLLNSKDKFPLYLLEDINWRTIEISKRENCNHN